MGTDNGNGKMQGTELAVKWLFGIIASLIASGCVLWLTTVNASIARLNEKEAEHGTSIAEIRGQLPHLTKQLDRIENKLDQAINQRPQPQKETHP